MINYTSDRQLSFSEFQTPFGTTLNPHNRWIRLSRLIPWDELVNIYARSLSPDFGRPTLDARIEVGALIVQHILTLSDEEVVEQIRENPYLQYFLGYSDYSYRQVFDPSLLVSIRKRLGAAAMLEMNELVAGHIENRAKQAKAPRQDSPQKNAPKTDASEERAPGADDSQKSKDDPKPTHRGKLLLDATVAPADIKYPTDLDLLNEARVHSEGIIDLLWQPGKGKVKPRTYRRKARANYLSVIKKRKKSKRILRKAIGKQLRYLKRNFRTIDRMLDEYGPQGFPLRFRDQRRLWIIKEVYRQQLQMYNTRTHRIDDRIVSIHQPHVRPIVRGKAGAADVEFGAKLSVSLIDGFAYPDHIRWDAFNESGDLIKQVETYRERFGVYPEVVISDNIYGTRANHAYLKSKSIRYSGKSLGRPPTRSDLNAAARQQQRRDNRLRPRIEGRFGLSKRKYGLDLVMTKTRLTSETYIGAVFLAMNLVEGLNKLFHVLYLSFLAVWQVWLPRLWVLQWACQVIFAVRSSNTNRYFGKISPAVSLN